MACRRIAATDDMALLALAMKMRIEAKAIHKSPRAPASALAESTCHICRQTVSCFQSSEDAGLQRPSMQGAWQAVNGIPEGALSATSQAFHLSYDKV